MMRNCQGGLVAEVQHSRNCYREDPGLSFLGGFAGATVEPVGLCWNCSATAHPPPPLRKNTAFGP